MPDRRTTVLVDFTVGKIELPDGYVHVPAKLELQDATAKDVAGAGNLKGFIAAIEKAMMAPIAAAFKKLTTFVVGLIAKLGPALIAVTVVIAGMIAAFKVLTTVMKFFAQILMVVYGALKALYLGWWNVNKAIVTFLAKPVVATIRKSIEVLREYVAVLKEVAQRGLELTKQFTRNMVSNFSEFEQNVANAVTRMNEFGAAGVRMRESVQRDVRDITLQSRRMASEAANAWLWITAAGVRGRDNIRNMTKAAVVLSEATTERLEETSMVMVKMMNQFQLGADQAMRGANALAAAVVGSPATLSDMAQALKYAGTTANLFGHSLEETLSMLMGLFQMGSTASTAGVEISQMFNAIAQGSDKTVKALAQVGITMDMIDPTKYKLYEIVGVFERLRDAIAARPGVSLADANAQIAKLLYTAFSQRAARGFASLVVVGTEAMARFRGEITNTIRAQQMQADQLNTLAGAWDIIRSKWEEIYYMVSDRFSPALRRGVEWLKAFVDVLMRGTMPTAMGGIFGHLTDTVTMFMRALSGPALTMFQRMLPVLAEGARYVRAAFAAVLPSATKLLRYLPEIAMEIVDLVGPAFLDMVKALGPFLVQWIARVTPALADLARNFLLLLATIFDLAGPTIIQWFVTLIDLLSGVTGSAAFAVPLLTQYLQLLISKLPAVWEAVFGVMPRVLEILAKFLVNVGNFVTVYLPLLVAWFGELLNVATTIVEQTLPALIDGLRKAAPFLIAIFQIMMDGIQKALELIRTVVANWDTIIRPALETIISALRTIFTEGVKLLSLWMKYAIVWIQIQSLLLQAKLILAGQWGLAEKLGNAVTKLLGPMRTVAAAVEAAAGAVGNIGGIGSGAIGTGGAIPGTGPGYPRLGIPGSGQGGGTGQGLNPSDVVLPFGSGWGKVIKTAQMMETATERRYLALGRGGVDIGPTLA